VLGDARLARGSPRAIEKFDAAIRVGATSVECGADAEFEDATQLGESGRVHFR
jgi:hypothetical protein